MAKTNRRSTSFSLSDGVLSTLKSLSAHHGMSQNLLVEASLQHGMPLADVQASSFSRMEPLLPASSSPPARAATPTSTSTSTSTSTPTPTMQGTPTPPKKRLGLLPVDGLSDGGWATVNERVLLLRLRVIAQAFGLSEDSAQAILDGDDPDDRLTHLLFRKLWIDQEGLAMLSEHCVDAYGLERVGRAVQMLCDHTGIAIRQAEKALA